MAVIETRDLRKDYGRVQALRGVTLKVEQGEVFGLLGQNGAGKTTLIKILLGIVKFGDGEATLFHHPAGTADVRKRVGYLPERVPIYPDMTVKGYITFWAKLRGFRNPRAQVDAVLERVQLCHLGGREVASRSAPGDPRSEGCCSYSVSIRRGCRGWQLVGGQCRWS